MIIILRKSDFNSDSVLVKSFPDADKAGPSGIFVNQDSNDDSIKSTVKVFDERKENTVDVDVPDIKQADNTSTSDLAEDCAEDEWSCHMKGKHILMIEILDYIMLSDASLDLNFIYISNGTKSLWTWTAIHIN